MTHFRDALLGTWLLAEANSGFFSQERRLCDPRLGSALARPPPQGWKVGVMGAALGCGAAGAEGASQAGSGTWQGRVARPRRRGGSL